MTEQPNAERKGLGLAAELVCAWPKTLSQTAQKHESVNRDSQCTAQDVLRPWFAGRILLIDDAIAERWGVLAGQRRLKGRPLSVADGLIAATALHHKLTVVMRNVKDFESLGVMVLIRGTP